MDLGLGLGLIEKPTFRFCAGIHFVCALTLPVLILVLMGCKKAHEEKADLGPQASSDEIDRLLSKVSGHVNFSSLQVGQKLYYEESRRVAGQDTVSLVGNHGITVIGKRESDGTQITVHHSELVRATDHFESQEYEDTLVVPAATVLSSMLAGTVASLRSAKFSDIKAESSNQPVRITYHNLRSSEDHIPAPDAVAHRAGCGGLASCQLHVLYIQYDEVKWFSDTAYDKMRYDFALTSDVPYMSGLLGLMVSGCVGLSVPVGDKHFFVRDCQNLLDFQK